MKWFGGSGAEFSPIMRPLAILAALVAMGLSAAAPAAHFPGTFNDSETAYLDKLSAYLNGIHTLKSNFVQLGPQGDLSEGEFDLAKPGKLRFAYNPPSPVLVGGE